MAKKSWEKEKKRIGQNILKLCEEEGISIYELAEELDMDKTTIWRYVKGYRYPSTHNLIKIAKRFGKTIEEIS